MEKTVRRKVVLTHRYGLHARPAAMLVGVASQFDAEILVGLGEIAVNAKSILGILSLGARPGSVLTLSAEGDDAEAAVAALEALIRSCFEEAAVACPGPWSGVVDADVEDAPPPS